MRYLRIALAALVVTVAIVACSSGSGSGSPAATSGSAATSGPAGTPTTSSGGGTPAEAAITILNFKYGDPLTVKPGATVTVTNQDSVRHDVVADDGGFKTELLGKGESSTFTAPTTPGTYTFSCTAHPASMTGIGTLVVQG